MGKCKEHEAELWTGQLSTTGLQNRQLIRLSQPPFLKTLISSGARRYLETGREHIKSRMETESEQEEGVV